MPKTKKKSRKIEPPKRASSKYAFFVRENYKKLRQSLSSSTTHLMVMRKLRERWNSLRSAEKARYLLMAEQDRRRYARELNDRIDEIITNALS